jgi:PAS domain S-box-containing protein
MLTQHGAAVPTSMPAVGLGLLGVALLSIFLLDFFTPLGVAAWALYALPLWYAARLRFRAVVMVLLVGLLSTVLTVLGFYLSPPGIDPAIAAVNRTLGMALLWTMAMLLLRVDERTTKSEADLMCRTEAERQLRELNAELESRVSQRTTAMLEANAALRLEVEERKRAEQQLLYQLGLTQGITEKATDSIFVTDDEWRVTFMNPEAEKVFGFASSELIGEMLHDKIHHHYPDGRVFPMSECPLGQIYRSGEATRDHEDVFFRKDGSMVHVVCSNAPLEIGGIRVGAVLIFRDVTERKMAEERLRDSERRFRDLVESLPQLIWTCRPDGQCDYLSRQWLNYTGIPVERQLGSGWLDQLHPDDRQDCMASWRQAVEVGQVFHTDFRIRRADGAYRWFRTRAAPVRDAQDRILKWFGTNTDIDESKRAEEISARLAAIVESSEDAIISKSLDGEVLTWNSGAEKIFGYTAGEIIGQPIVLIIPPDRVHEERRIMAEIRRGERIEPYETVRRRKDGIDIHVSLSISPIKDSKGGIIGISKNARDITAKKRAEQALRESEARFRAVFEGNMVPMGLFHVDGGIVSANDALLALIRYSRDDLNAGRLDWKTMTPPEYLSADERALAEMTVDGRCTPFEKEYVRQDGSRVPVLVGGAMLSHDPLSTGVFFALDLTERKGAETDIRRLLEESIEQQHQLKEKQAQLVQSSKLASIGELATGIAHEINNPLNNINLFVGNVLDQIEHGECRADFVARNLRNAVEQVKRAATIIDHLRSFARVASVHYEPASLNYIVEVALSFMSEQLRLHSVTVDLQLCEADPVIMANRIQLEQVLINLITNARDAMDASPLKTLTLTTGVEGDQAKIRVEDVGMGIPPEMIVRIFDPFFTTKPVGKGTGLGLSISYGIVKEHRGTIEVNSTPGVGSTFIVTLPVMDAQQGSEPEESSP